MAATDSNHLFRRAAIVIWILLAAARGNSGDCTAALGPADSSCGNYAEERLNSSAGETAAGFSEDSNGTRSERAEFEAEDGRGAESLKNGGGAEEAEGRRGEKRGEAGPGNVESVKSGTPDKGNTAERERDAEESSNEPREKNGSGVKAVSGENNTASGNVDLPGNKLDSGDRELLRKALASDRVVKAVESALREARAGGGIDHGAASGGSRSSVEQKEEEEEEEEEEEDRWYTSGKNPTGFPEEPPGQYRRSNGEEENLRGDRCRWRGGARGWPLQGRVFGGAEENDRRQRVGHGARFPHGERRLRGVYPGWRAYEGVGGSIDASGGRTWGGDGVFRRRRTRDGRRRIGEVP